MTTDLSYIEIISTQFEIKPSHEARTPCKMQAVFWETPHLHIPALVLYQISFIFLKFNFL